MFHISLTVIDVPSLQQISKEDEFVPTSVNPKQDLSIQLVDGMEVRGYQHELAEPGLRGDNYICVAPTGTGKTLVAALIIINHLNRNETNTHVAFIVKTKSLAEQQKNYFEKKIPKAYVGVCTGETKKILTVSQSVLLNHITVCTGGALYEELRQKKVSFSKFSLLMFDECHHASKSTESAHYTEILMLFLENMLQESSESVQIVGFTASLGAGKNPHIEEKVAMRHLKSLAAHMNATGGIKTVVDSKNIQELESYKNLPKIEQFELHPRDPTNDLFIHKVLGCMKKIEKNIEFKWNDFIPRWFQQYESKIDSFINILRQIDEEGFRDNLRASYELLNYCTALSVYMDLQKEDAINALEEVANIPEDIIKATPTETLYKQMREDLVKELQPLQPVKNPLLEKLEKVLYDSFNKNGDSRGLIFVRSRVKARAMTDWVASNLKLQEVGIHPCAITGHTSKKDGMSQTEQKEIMDKFRNGSFNLLLATSVVEEGIDVPDCNLVVRYLYSSTEIEQEQAMGRARSSNSEYYSIFTTSSCKKYQELKNAELIKLVRNTIRNFPCGQMLCNEISKIQQSIMQEEQQKQEMLLRRKKYSGTQVELKCHYCHTFACKGSDVKMAGISPSYHYVVPSKDFETKYIEDRHPRPKIISSEIYDSHKIKCKECGKDWGVKFIWSSSGKKYPVLKCNKFSFKIEDMTETYRQWKKVPFEIELLKSNDDLYSIMLPKID